MVNLKVARIFKGILESQNPAKNEKSFAKRRRRKIGDERVNQARIKHTTPLSEPNASLTGSESHPIPAGVRLGRPFFIARSYSLEAIQLPRLFCAVASLPISRAGGRDFGGNRAMPISARHKFSKPLENASMDSNFT